MNSQKDNKRFWIILGIVFLFSTITIGISFFNSSALTGNLAVQFISSAREGEKLFVEVRNVEGIQFMEIGIKDNLKNAKITTEETNNPKWFKGRAYSFFKVSSEDAAKLGIITYTLKLDEKVMSTLGIKSSDIKLYYEGLGLSTKLVKSESGYSYYTASVQGLGQFAIGKEEANAEGKITTVIKAPPEEDAALTGKASGEEGGSGFFTKIKNFFKNFFG